VNAAAREAGAGDPVEPLRKRLAELPADVEVNL
jgi:hypothetical protein